MGMRDLRCTLAAQFAIPTLFGSQLDSNDKVGFQSVLLFGLPGTGKTMLVCIFIPYRSRVSRDYPCSIMLTIRYNQAQSLTATTDMTFFKLDSAILKFKYVGDTDKAIKALAEAAKTHTPSFIFTDEIDVLAGNRQSGESRHETRSTDALLETFSTMAEVPSIFIVGATNRPRDLDPAFPQPFSMKGLPWASQTQRLHGTSESVTRGSLALGFSPLPGTVEPSVCSTGTRAGFDRCILLPLSGHAKRPRVIWLTQQFRP